MEYLLGPCALLSLIFNYKFTLAEILWSFSIFLESVAILPQLFLLQRTGEAETITTHYLAALGAYRAFYIPNWIYRCVPRLVLLQYMAHPDAQVLDRRRGRPHRGHGGHRTDGVVPRLLLRLLHKVSSRTRLMHAHADVSLRSRVSSQPLLVTQSATRTEIRTTGIICTLIRAVYGLLLRSPAVPRRLSVQLSASTMRDIISSSECKTRYGCVRH